MSFKHLTAATALLSVLLVSAPLQAKSPAPLGSVIDSNVATRFSAPMLGELPAFNPTAALAQSVIPDASATLANDVAADGAAASDGQDAVAAAVGANITDLRKSLLAVAMGLRDTRYVRGGRDPSTGFDCSGFVRYVFAHAVGMQLPRNSASQFLAGLKVNRADMQPGDLVFFRTHGKRSISHVGIYIANGRFIHSPATGKSVEISSLKEGYWAKRFAGAKRPEAMAQVADKG
ncbi:C40 family peptidase [Rhodanobacter ginsengiterrae]|uniref:C40 family peptidase n=1 Tax=Rhodanobacter ginsengiterrae TaxID=2008451 RepID=UPI003CE800DE